MDKTMLSEKTIRLAAAYPDKEAAIRDCGRLLLEAGFVAPEYVDAMVKRDELSTTYIGNGVAVPHGTEASRAFVKKTGLAVVQVPGGVDFGKGRIAKLLVGVAALGNEHIDILTDIAQVCVDNAAMEKLLTAKTAPEVLSVISGQGK